MHVHTRRRGNFVVPRLRRPMKSSMCFPGTLSSPSLSLCFAFPQDKRYIILMIRRSTSITARDETKKGKGLRVAIMHSGAPSPGMNPAVRAFVRLGLHKGHTMLGICILYSSSPLIYSLLLLHAYLFLSSLLLSFPLVSLFFAKL